MKWKKMKNFTKTLNKTTTNMLSVDIDERRWGIETDFGRKTDNNESWRSGDNSSLVPLECIEDIIWLSDELRKEEDDIWKI